MLSMVSDVDGKVKQMEWHSKDVKIGHGRFEAFSAER